MAEHIDDLFNAMNASKKAFASAIKPYADEILRIEIGTERVPGKNQCLGAAKAHIYRIEGQRLFYTVTWLDYDARENEGDGGDYLMGLLEDHTNGDAIIAAHEATKAAAQATSDAKVAEHLRRQIDDIQKRINDLKGAAPR